MKIIKQEVFDDLAKLVSISAPGSDYELEKGVDGYQVDFDIVFNEKEYHITFQNEERTDGMKAYSPHGMTTASQFGCDVDQSGELSDENEGSDEALSAISELEKIADALCEKWLDSEMEV